MEKGKSAGSCTETATTEIKHLNELTSTVTLEYRSEPDMNANESLPSSSDTKIVNKKRGQKAFKTPDLSATLDKVKASHRTALIIAGETTSLGHNLNEVSLSHSTI